MTIDSWKNAGKGKKADEATPKKNHAFGLKADEHSRCKKTTYIDRWKTVELSSHKHKREADVTATATPDTAFETQKKLNEVFYEKKLKEERLEKEEEFWDKKRLEEQRFAEKQRLEKERFLAEERARQAAWEQSQK